jgi:hypothetical protein
MQIRVPPGRFAAGNCIDLAPPPSPPHVTDKSPPAKTVRSGGWTKEEVTMENARRIGTRRAGIAAAALLTSALVLTVVATGPATAEPTATASASVTKQVKNLKRLVVQLRQDVESLRGQGGDVAPRGPAGGDLAGTYPNPLIGPNAVAGEQITDGSVGEADLATASVSTDEIGTDQVRTADIIQDSVGTSELKGVTYAVSTAGTFISPGNAGSATVSCPGGGMVLAGGFGWRDNESNSMIASAPRESDPARTWDVTGFVPSGAGSDNQLYAWATCLLG